MMPCTLRALGFLLWLAIVASVQVEAAPSPAASARAPDDSSAQENLRGDLDRYSRELYGQEYLNKRRQIFRERAQERFRNADSDGNGRLSREELARLHPNAARHFDLIDTDGDGEVSPQEMAQALRKRAELRRRQEADMLGGTLQGEKK
jgi:glycine/D-amino acid oxidase-like deaminating enzyme